jgi:hypothetical protein
MICSIIVAIALAVSTLAAPMPTREYSYILGVPDVLTLSAEDRRQGGHAGWRTDVVSSESLVRRDTVRWGPGILSPDARALPDPIQWGPVDVTPTQARKWPCSRSMTQC